MKKNLILLAMLAAGMTAFAADGDAPKTDFAWKSGETVDWTAHFRVGVNVPTGTPDGYKFAPFRSWDLEITFLQMDWNPGKGRQTYSIGLGYGWHNYTLKDNGTMFQKVGSVTGLGQFASTMSDTYSRLHVGSISMPVLFTQKIGKKQGLSIGGEVNFNVSGHLSNGYEQGDDYTRIQTSSIGLRPVTVDIMGIYDFGGLAIYAKYSPMNKFKKDRGPEFKSLSFGLYF